MQLIVMTGEQEGLKSVSATVINVKCKVFLRFDLINYHTVIELNPNL